MCPAIFHGVANVRREKDLIFSLNPERRKAGTFMGTLQETEAERQKPP